MLASKLCFLHILLSDTSFIFSEKTKQAQKKSCFIFLLLWQFGRRKMSKQMSPKTGKIGPRTAQFGPRFWTSINFDSLFNKMYVIKLEIGGIWWEFIGVPTDVVASPWCMSSLPVYLNRVIRIARTTSNSYWIIKFTWSNPNLKSETDIMYSSCNSLRFHMP